MRQKLVEGRTPFSIDFVSVWGSTLHHIDDLPYDPVEYFPHIYGNFRKKGENIKVRELLESPKTGDLPFIKLDNATDTEKKALSFIP